MTNKNRPFFYLLGESAGLHAHSPWGSFSAVEFLTLPSADSDAVAVFLSRLDAEIFRQQQNRDGRNNYVIIESRDRRLEMLRVLNAVPGCLVAGFAIDPASGWLSTAGGTYSTMHCHLAGPDRQWILNGTSEPDVSIMDSIRWFLASAGEATYLSEIAELEHLSDSVLEALAREAIGQISVSPVGRPILPIVFSPRRRRWVELTSGGDHVAK